MSDPEVTCLTCGRRKKCVTDYGRVTHPDKVRASLRRSCRYEGVGPKPCNFQYRAGVDVAGIRALLREPPK